MLSAWSFPLQVCAWLCVHAYISLAHAGDLDDFCHHAVLLAELGQRWLEGSPAHGWLGAPFRAQPPLDADRWRSLGAWSAAWAAFALGRTLRRRRPDRLRAAHHLVVLVATGVAAYRPHFLPWVGLGQLVAADALLLSAVHLTHGSVERAPRWLRRACACSFLAVRFAYAGGYALGGAIRETALRWDGADASQRALAFLFLEAGALLVSISAAWSARPLAMWARHA